MKAILSLSTFPACIPSFVRKYPSESIVSIPPRCEPSARWYSDQNPEDKEEMSTITNDPFKVRKIFYN
jgi:hypothetical protein